MSVCIPVFDLSDVIYLKIDNKIIGKHARVSFEDKNLKVEVGVGLAASNTESFPLRKVVLTKPETGILMLASDGLKLKFNAYGNKKFFDYYTGFAYENGVFTIKAMDTSRGNNIQPLQQHHRNDVSKQNGTRGPPPIQQDAYASGIIGTPVQNRKNFILTLTGGETVGRTVAQEIIEDSPPVASPSLGQKRTSPPPAPPPAPQSAKQAAAQPKKKKKQQQEQQQGAAKRKTWTEVEEAALAKGVKKYGSGQWRLILDDPLFKADLAARSNVNLKDKWRNLSIP